MYFFLSLKSRVFFSHNFSKQKKCEKKEKKKTHILENVSAINSNKREMKKKKARMKNHHSRN
jgi:hypothetical protein